MGSPKVSVIVPVYNVREYVGECLDSLLGQTLQDVEVICVDDCSTDGSLAVLDRYASLDRRVKIIRHEQNTRQGRARNDALAIASGTYVACVDPDDWITPDMLESACEVLDAHGLDSVWVKFKKSADSWQCFEELSAHPGGFIDITPETINLYPLSSCNKVYRTSFLKEHDVHWANGLYYEDTEFYFRFYVRSRRTFLLDKPCYVYRYRQSSTMVQSFSGSARCEELFAVLHNIHRFLVEDGFIDEYRNAYLDQVARAVDMFLNNRAYGKRTVAAAGKLLDAIGFKENFRGCDSYDYLNGAILSPFHRAVKKASLFLLRFFPVPSLRRAYRKKMLFYPRRGKPNYLP